MNGADYTLNGNVITPLHNYIDTLYVPVKVNDGIDDSPVFLLMIKVPDANFITENESNKNILLFPNPADNFLEINILAKDEHIDFIDIFDAKGLHFLKTLLKNHEKIDISSLKKGMYFISIRSNKKLRILKFIKE
jgi:hypothetical protein